MRPEAATFCANCGQDLRPGASVGDMRPGATIVRKLPPGSPAGTRQAGQGPPSALLGATPPTVATDKTTKPSGAPRALRMPRLGRGHAAPPKAPTPAAPDTRSFTDRYRGTTFETPEAKAMAPARPTTRVVRLGGILIVILAVVAVAGYGALQVVSSPAAVVATATPTGSAIAQASATPRPAVTPAPAVTFTADQQAEIAFCLAVPESRGLDADIASVRAAVTAAQHADVATQATALVARIAEMRVAATEMDALPLLGGYAGAYDAALKAAAAAASSLAAAGSASDAKAEAKAVTALVAAQAKVDATSTRTALVTANPQLACTAAG
jgi:hypothetical protein